jgi:tRNA threonylcarbamoyladenosine biosynthesis protein TsaE
MILESQNPSETEDFAVNLAGRIKTHQPLCLYGELGAGKSLLARAMIRTLCENPALDVPSPTFTLAQYYETNRGPLTHFDLYRLQDPSEILEIGWDEAMHGLVIIEWPERLGVLLPPNRIDVFITAPLGNPLHRKLEVIEP